MNDFKIPRNLGTLDRVIRLATGVFAIIYSVGELYGSRAELAFWIFVGTIGFFTGIYGACPIYYKLKISTLRDKKR